MKLLLALSRLLTFVHAVAVPGKVSYDNYQVIRLGVGNNLPKVNGLLREFSVPTWNGAPKADGHVDVVVPDFQLKAFQDSTTNMESRVMHENLGASIAKETAYKKYIGIKRPFRVMIVIVLSFDLFVPSWQRQFYLVRFVSSICRSPSVSQRSPISACCKLRNCCCG